MCAGSYRIVGVTLLTCFERDEFLLYILVRLLYVFFILGSGFVAPLYNPVLAFADASLWPHRLGSVALSGLTLRGWVSDSACCICFLAGELYNRSSTVCTGSSAAAQDAERSERRSCGHG